MNYVRFKGHCREYAIEREQIIGFEALENQCVNCNLILKSGAHVYINGLNAEDCEKIVADFDCKKQEVKF